MEKTEKTILIIDDDDSIRSLLSTHLKQAGHHPITAETGQDGITLAQKIKPDLILLDVALPDISGLETLKKLKQDSDLAEIPVVILSGYPLNQGTNIFLEAGAADFLTKSFKLKDVINQCLAFIPSS